MVYHPPLLNQTCDIDSIPAEFSPLKDICEELQTYSVPFVYVDPKLTWLSTNNLKQALTNITHCVHLLLRRGSSVIVTIAASDDRSGKFLSRSEAFQSSPYFATSQLSWTVEWTEVDKARDILARAKKHPTISNGHSSNGYLKMFPKGMKKLFRKDPKSWFFGQQTTMITSEVRWVWQKTENVWGGLGSREKLES
jgi:hypothetical protein